ncbi:MAG: terminase small subunit [Pseudomonadota bacterium]
MGETDATGAGDLRPLTDAEAAAIAAHPLPDGVPDAIVNLYQLADALDVSGNTITAWRREGMPVEAEGTNGRSYQFRLSLCFAWRQARDGAEQAARAHAEDATQQLRLALIGDQAGAAQRAGLSPKEQRELMALEVEWLNAARRRREVIDADDVAEGVEAVLGAIRDALDALPDRAARELALSPVQADALQRMADDVLRQAGRDLAKIAGIDDAGTSAA